MRLRTVVLVLIVVAVIVAGYVALTWNAKAVDDFDQDEPSTDWDAYATFEITTTVWKVTSTSANGVVDSIVPDVEPFEDMSTGRVYDELDLLKGHGGGGGTAAGETWINVTITGSNFKAYWESVQTVILEDNLVDNPAVITYSTGRVFFENAGTYTITVKVMADIPITSGWPYQIGSKSQGFEVSI